MEERGVCMLEAKGWAAMGQAMARALCQAWGGPKARPRSGQAVPRVGWACQARPWPGLCWVGLRLVGLGLGIGLGLVLGLGLGMG